jgi:hypothetical protein
MLAAGFHSWGIEIGLIDVSLPADHEQASLTAIAAAWGKARERFGALVVDLWRFASGVTGGELLGEGRSWPHTCGDVG